MIDSKLFCPWICQSTLGFFCYKEKTLKKLVWYKVFELFRSASFFLSIQKRNFIKWHFAPWGLNHWVILVDIYCPSWFNSLEAFEDFDQIMVLIFHLLHVVLFCRIIPRSLMPREVIYIKNSLKLINLLCFIFLCV